MLNSGIMRIIESVLRVNERKVPFKARQICGTEYLRYSYRKHGCVFGESPSINILSVFISLLNTSNVSVISLYDGETWPPSITSPS